MTRAEFLDALSAQLHALTNDERESALSYYREYLDEAGADEAAAIDALGSPQSVAERIIREIGENRVAYAGSTSVDYQYPIPDAPAASRSGSPDGAHIAVTVLVILVTSPIWITVFSLWLALLFTLAVVLASLAFAAIAAPIQGIGEMIGGMTGVGIWDIGCGILSLGFVLLCWKPFWLAAKHFSIGLWKLCKACIKGLLGKENS